MAAMVTPSYIFRIGGSVVGVGVLGFGFFALFRNNVALFKGADKVDISSEVKNLALFQRNGLDEEAFSRLVQHLQSFSRGELDKVSAEKAIDAANFQLAVQAQLNQAQLQKDQAEIQARLKKEQAETQAKLQKEQAETQAAKHHDEVVRQAAEATKQTIEMSAAVTRVAYAAGIAYFGYAIREAVRVYTGR